MQPVTWYTARPLLDLMLALEGLEPPVLDPAAAWRVFKDYLAVPSAVGSVVGGFHCSVVSDESLGPGVLVRFVREIGDPEQGGTRVRNVFLQLVYNESQEGLEDRDLWVDTQEDLSGFVSQVEALPEFRFAMEATPVAGEVFVEETEP
jgi:hypothetical protein